jgi:hypothetical protein
MEEKKKDLLRKLTIVSIPFVFVAIPSVVIIVGFVGMLSPHAAEPWNGSSPAPPGQNHSVSMLSTMTGGQMILSCRAAFSGNCEYFHYFILDPYKPQRAFFQPQADPYVLFCKWGYMGNFLQDVVVFNSSAAWAPHCRVDNGGCRYFFQDGHTLLVIGKHGGHTLLHPGPVQAAACLLPAWSWFKWWRRRLKNRRLHLVLVLVLARVRVWLRHHLRPRIRSGRRR